MDYKNYFKGKEITVMGLGLLGRGVGDTAFLAECGAKLLVTDLKTKEQLKESLKKLRKYRNIKYVLGEHRLEDFKNKDFILKSAGVPTDSIFIKEARKNKIPIEMSASLFARLANVPIIGVTGTRGKSTVTYLIKHILDTADGLNRSHGAVGRTARSWRAVLGGNVLGVSTLALLPKVKNADYALFELDSWQLQGFGEAKISPHIAVFTTFMDDHLNYYKGNRTKYFADKTNIFMYQKKDDVLIVGREVSKMIKRKSRVPGRLPKSWKLKIPGEHNRENAALAVETARALKIPEKIIRQAVESFTGVPGRLELVRVVNGTKIYNDTTATTPDATLVALRALGERKSSSRRIVLIAGGADKGLDMKKLIREIPNYCKEVVLLAGSGTDRLKTKAEKFDDLSKAIRRAYKLAGRGDTILFSPAFASFGMFKNEYNRGEQFNRLVKKLK